MLTQLEGKPFIITLDGKTRKIGKIEAALISPDRDLLTLSVILTDEEVAGILGAAQDESEAAESPIGMSEAEILAAIEDSTPDPGPLTQQIDFIQKADI